MIQQARAFIDEVAEAKDTYGLLGTARRAANRALTRWASLNLVHVFVLDRARMSLPATDCCIETRFLTPAEVRRFTADPVNHLDPRFADRAEAGLDLCYAAIHGDRLASYGWYALHSVEAEHAAGTPLGLPPDIAYMYKGYTHPDFRGRRLYGACMGRALEDLEQRGVDRLLAFVYWSNSPSLRSFDRLGYERLGLLAIGPRGPTRVPSEARRLGVLFGDEAQAALKPRRVQPTPPLQQPRRLASNEPRRPVSH